MELNVDDVQMLAGECKLEGWFDRLDDRVYHKLNGISSTGLKYFRVNGARYQKYLREPVADAANEGSLVHMALLEPHLFTKRVELKKHGSTKEGKAQVIEAARTGMLLAQPKVYENVMQLQAAVKNNERLSEVISRNSTEVSGFAVEKELGLQLRIRCDILDRVNNVIYDIKTVPNDMNEKVCKIWADRNGFVDQSAFYHYVAGLVTGKVHTMYQVFIESKDPWGVRFFKVSQETIDDYLKNRVLPLLPEFKKCLVEDHWPGYPCEDLDLSVRSMDSKEELNDEMVGV